MKLTLEQNSTQTTVDVFSPEGLEMVSKLWIQLSTEFRHTHECKWMGIPIIQLTNDILMMQELIWQVKPDVIVECGVAHGGSTVYYASILELLRGRGKVIGVDIEIRQHNREAIESHPMSGRIQLIEQSSTAPESLEKVKSMIADGDKVLVILDSNHTTEHVLDELRLYHPLVTEGSYIVAMDGAQAWVAEIPSAKEHWAESHPLKAVELFLHENKQFEVDDHYTRLKVTANPNGFLKRISS